MKLFCYFVNYVRIIKAELQIFLEFFFKYCQKYEVEIKFKIFACFFGFLMKKTMTKNNYDFYFDTLKNICSLYKNFFGKNVILKMAITRLKNVDFYV